MVQRLRFSINVQRLSHKFGLDSSQAVPAVKTPMGAVAKTHKIAFKLHIYGCVAKLCRKNICNLDSISMVPITNHHHHQHDQD